MRTSAIKSASMHTGMQSEPAAPRQRFRHTGIFIRMAVTAALLPSLASAQQDASQASYLQYRQCLASALHVRGHPAGQTDFAMAQSKCTARRAQLYDATYQGLRAEGRPESMSRRIASDAVDTLEKRIRSQLIGESQRSP